MTQDREQIIAEATLTDEEIDTAVENVWSKHDTLADREFWLLLYGAIIDAQLAKALPIIEKAVREHILEEIEAEVIVLSQMIRRSYNAPNLRESMAYQVKKILDKCVALRSSGKEGEG